MEVFKIFATLSLVDMLSGPLRKIRQEMRGVDEATTSLHARMGRLALAMGPLAIASGVMLGAFGKCVATAAGFEDQIAKVGAVSRASGAELKALEDKARELGATTQFTAVQVGQAEQYLAMAGFSVQENLDALPGVLNLAAATATDLGRAADISSDILGAFGLKASEMTRVADTLALTCAQANTDMELLGDTMKYVAPIARKAGLSLEETAAMAGLLGDVGIKGSQAGTTMKAMLGKLAAPSKEAATLMQRLGVTTKDAAGNLRSPIQVLGELTGKLQKMGSADQIEALKKIVGEEAMAGFSELLNQADGSGKLLEKINNLVNGSGTAAEMAAKQNDTLAGSVRGMGSAWESLQISVGKIFLPIVRKVVDAITGLLRLLDGFAQSRFGSAILKMASALATAVVAVTAFAGGMWAIGKAAPQVGKFLLTLKTSLLGLGAPIWALIAAAGLFYAAWKADFGGIATVLTRWWNNIKLAVNGVIAIFNNLKGSSSEIRGELARDIKAAGLEGLVTSVARIVYRVKEYFAGIWDALDFGPALRILEPAFAQLGAVLDHTGKLLSRLFGSQSQEAGSGARQLGEVVGGVLTKALEVLAGAASVLVQGVDNLIRIFNFLLAIFTGDAPAAAEALRSVFEGVGELFARVGDLFGVGDAIRGAWAEVMNFLDGIDLFESGAKLLTTLINGIKSAASGLVDSVKGVFQKVRNLLPFSDAREGPLSTLTLSGTRLMTTLGEGVNAGFPSLMQTISGKFQTLKDGLGSVWQSLFGGEDAPEFNAPKMPEPPGMPGDVAQERQHDAASRAGGQTQPSFTLHIANITLPNVKDANDFYDQLKSAAMEYGESMA
ncbi:phage tail tape measure protein [Desulfovibrio sp. ZJ200]|uniref:phage tail tape measure protein n=1 Tax=Desulfovibrio sp. ZJ200 TaxID=2709792 RepID=UPI0013EA6ADA|nr:phage tail tape measure protein [Desulfovibrio sp. ZJ200]